MKATGEDSGSPRSSPTEVSNEVATDAGAVAGHDTSTGAAGERWVKVWDLPTRLVPLAAGACSSRSVCSPGFVAPEWWMGVHVWAGYGLVALMVFRLVWGIFGSEYSRVVSFIYPPRDTFEHLRGLLLLRPPHHVGHNPTGALMVFALTGVLIALVVTGLLVLGGEEKQGPLAAVVGYSVGVGRQASTPLAHDSPARDGRVSRRRRGDGERAHA